MRVPEIKQNVTNINKEEKVIIKEVNELMTADYEDVHKDMIDNQDAREKYFKYIESIVRTSPEYRTYIYTLINEFDLTHCAFFRQINVIDVDVSIEFHHYPFTLYDIVNIVFTNKVNKAMSGEEPDCYRKYMSELLNPYKLADEIMKLHYENLVSLVPLTKTAHEIAHNGMVFIPLTKDFVFGNYKGFYNRYNINFDSYPDKLGALEKLTQLYVEGKSELDLSKFEIIKTQIQMEMSEPPQEIKNISEGQNIA